MNERYDRYPPPPYHQGGHPPQPPEYGQYPPEGYGHHPQQQGYYQYSYPSGQPKDDGMSSGMLVLIIVVILMCVMIPIFIGANLAGPWSGGLADTEDTVTTLYLYGGIEVDVYSTTINVSLEHRGGDPIDCYELHVTVGGESVSGNPINPVTGRTATTTTVGETAMWTMSNYAGTFLVGDQYTVKVIVIETSNIAWQKDITAMHA